MHNCLVSVETDFSNVDLPVRTTHCVSAPARRVHGPLSGSHRHRHRHTFPMLLQPLLFPVTHPRGIDHSLSNLPVSISILPEILFSLSGPEF
ncbi:hypothetical protein VNO80_09956 [Phaseolus coccineus]|uniref:Uncharacterized protein n=1 Tax=Phaseolus coccineus TaxID=3886 RepID=A0AAN9N7U3_PHACN